MAEEAGAEVPTALAAGDLAPSLRRHTGGKLGCLDAFLVCFADSNAAWEGARISIPHSAHIRPVHWVCSHTVNQQQAWPMQGLTLQPSLFPYATNAPPHKSGVL